MDLNSDEKTGLIRLPLAPGEDNLKLRFWTQREFEIIFDPSQLRFDRKLEGPVDDLPKGEPSPPQETPGYNLRSKIEGPIDDITWIVGPNDEKFGVPKNQKRSLRAFLSKLLK